MYNGIGLLTPRGSGTSGYVTANKFNLKRAPVQQEESRRPSETLKTQKPNEDILLHNKKREIEVKLFELQVKLEDEDKLSPERVQEMLEMERAVLEEQFAKARLDETSKPTVQETHEVAKRKMEQMKHFRMALGIRDDVRDGEPFQQQQQQREQQSTRSVFQEERQQREPEGVTRLEEMERERHRQSKEEKPRGAEERKRKEEPHHKSHDRSAERVLRRLAPPHRAPLLRHRPSSIAPPPQLKTHLPTADDTACVIQERLSPGRGTFRREEGAARSRDRYERDDRWLGEVEGRPSDRAPMMDAPAGGKNAWTEERGRSYYPQRRYSDNGPPPPEYRFNDQERGGPYRQRFYDRGGGRFVRGRGRRFPSGRGYRSHEMSGPGYYRIGEAAPERYDPANDAQEGQSSMQGRWQKMDLEVEEDPKTKPDRVESFNEDPTPRVGAYRAEYDAHAALAGKERGAERAKKQESRSSPVPRSPSSLKQSPSQPRCYRRAPDYRSESPSPSSPEKDQRKNEDATQKPQRSPSPKAAEMSTKEASKEKTQHQRRRKSSPPRSPAQKSNKSNDSKGSKKSRDRSTSRSASSRSSRSQRERPRDRSIEKRHHPSPRRYHDDRSRHTDYRRGNRYGGDRWRQFDSYRGGPRGGYRNRRPGYGYNPQGSYGSWRPDRRHERRPPRSRSRSRERRHRSRSFTRSSSSSSGDRKRDRSNSSSSLSRGRSSASDKKRRTESKSPAPVKNKS